MAAVGVINTPGRPRKIAMSRLSMLYKDEPAAGQALTMLSTFWRRKKSLFALMPRETILTMRAESGVSSRIRLKTPGVMSDKRSFSAERSSERHAKQSLLLAEGQEGHILTS
jgi:hypothetical protein